MRGSTGRRSPWLVAVLFIALGAQLTLSIREQSQTFDESVHIFSGYQYWQLRDFGANPEHPPLLKLVAAFPLLFNALEPTVPLVGPSKPTHGDGGVDFLYRNSRPADRILFESRLGASIIAGLLALLVLIAAREIAGPGAGLLALTLLVFEPNVLAHGALVTTDVAASTFIFAAVFAYYRYACRATPWRLIACGVAVGLAFASKHTAILLVFIMPLLAAGDIFLSRTRGRALILQAVRASAALGVVSVVALLVLWSMYAFQYAARPDGFDLSPSLADHADALRSDWQTRLILIAARFQLIPEAYLWGLADILFATQGRSTFLFGTVYPNGQWFYFPAVFVMKSTLAMLALLLAAPFVLGRMRGRGERTTSISARAFWFLIVPPAVIMATSVMSRLNIGFRHILPIVPFLLVLAAAAAMALAQRSRGLAWAVGIVVAAHIASSLRAYPHYLTYSNELVGGPSKTYQVMGDSNVDWGQGLAHAAKYLSARGIRKCWFAPLQTHVDLRDVGIPCRTLQGSLRTGLWPAHPPVVEGTLLVSAHELSGQAWGPGELNPYGFLANRKPDALIANSILVYSGRFEIPIAAASNRARHAQRFLAEKRSDEAITAAREAVDLAPWLAETQGIMCQVLAGTGRQDEAWPFCEKAIEIANRVYPEYQYIRIPPVRAAASVLRRRNQ